MKSVLVFSGGLDSAVAAWELKSRGCELRLLSFDYGQRHKKELLAAKELANLVGAIEHKVVDLSAIRQLLSGSSQTDNSIPVPEGHWAEESMKKTIVPNRNMIMLSLAAAYAISIKANQIVYAAHSGDHAIYPDCRPDFIAALSSAVEKADWHKISLCAPFANMSKAEIVSLGSRLGVPFGKTWSCYKGGEKHCGKCGACAERRESFVLAGVPDPTEYENQ